MTKTKNPKKWSKFKFEVLRKSRGKQKFHWRIISCNGNIVVHSEKMNGQHGCRKTIKNLIEAIKKDEFRIVEKLIENE